MYRLTLNNKLIFIYLNNIFYFNLKPEAFTHKPKYMLVLVQETIYLRYLQFSLVPNILKVKFAGYCTPDCAILVGADPGSFDILTHCK